MPRFARRIQADEFNCFGKYGDAPPQACQEPRFIAAVDPGIGFSTGLPVK
jgi:hypothetical protein